MAKWEFHVRQRKMSLTTNIFNNVLQSSGFSPEKRLVREALQNSADAHREATDQPVSVRIEKRCLTGEDKRRLVAALRLDRDTLGDRSIELPEGNALSTITDLEVPLPILLISDFNTHGLGGRWDGTGEHDHFGRLVVNLGVDDKADAPEFSGGSFGFGKTVYGKASGIGVVAFYSVFQPSEASAGDHARFMATGLFKPHDEDTECGEIRYSGFAFFGAPHPDHSDETIPLVNEEAHEFAAGCGLQRRSEHEFGTTILIVDCDYDLEELKTAVELFWWPRLLRGDLDVVLADPEGEVFPRPRQNATLQPFIACYQNIISDSQDPPKSKIYRADRRIGAGGLGSLEPGTLSATVLEGENKYRNCVALTRGPGMVVKYANLGSDSLEPCAGVFIAHPDVEKILTFSEPQMHNEWDSNADRLKLKYPEHGERVVGSVMRRLENWFRDFQRMQEPPLPPGGLRPKESTQVLGRFLDVPGINPDPPSAPPPRPISISVSEDRVIRDDEEIWDEATIVLDLRSDYEETQLECAVTVTHEVLGDSSLRLVERTEAQLEDGDGNILAMGAPPTFSAVLKKGEPRTFVAFARTDAIATTRMRVAVEEVR